MNSFFIFRTRKLGYIFPTKGSELRDPPNHIRMGKEFWLLSSSFINSTCLIYIVTSDKATNISIKKKSVADLSVQSPSRRYGDRVPKSLFARFFGILWILAGLVLCSFFIATFTSALTASSIKQRELLLGVEVGWDSFLQRVRQVLTLLDITISRQSFNFFLEALTFFHVGCSYCG